MTAYKFPENITFDDLKDLKDDYFIIYDIEVFEGEDNTITTMVDGEITPVTEEFLRSLNTMVGGIYWTTSINEFGKVMCERRVIREVEDDDGGDVDIVFDEERPTEYDNGYETEGEDLPEDY